MTRPAASPLAEDLYEACGAWGYDDETHGWPLLHLCIATAMGTMDLVDQLVRPPVDDRGPWETLLDIDHCPAILLPWLAQTAGVDPVTLVGLSEADQRQVIRDTAAIHRGTPAAIVGAALPYLTGTKTVFFNERAGSAYQLRVATWGSETPETDWLERTNLATNPRAGAGATTGWTNEALASLTAVTLDGSTHPEPSADMEALGISTALLCVADTADDRAAFGFAAVDGTTYTCSVYVRLAALSATSIRLRVATASVIKATGNAAFETVDQWVRLDLTFTADSTETYFFRIYQSGSGDATWYHTGALIEESPELRDYFDGDRPGYRWTGTPHGSASERVLTNIVERAIRSQKPAGIVLTYATIAGGDFETLLNTHTDFADVDATFADFDELRTDPSLT